MNTVIPVVFFFRLFILFCFSNHFNNEISEAAFGEIRIVEIFMAFGYFQFHLILSVYNME